MPLWHSLALMFWPRHLRRLTQILLAAAFCVLMPRAAEEEPAIPAGTKTVQDLIESSRDSIVVIKQAGRDGTREGIGTGFVISRDGLIATSLHVVGEGRALTVTFADGKSRAVTAIHAWDRKLDLAIIRVEADILPKLPLGDSDNLKQGATVVAIGNPQGLSRSIVQGVVSGLRDFEFARLIQLAIPIEPGNSGGPLLDMKGRVQGILNMKAVVTENLGFAIPINALKPLIERPNSVPIEKWLAIGALNPNLWTPVMGARWRQKAGTITVDGVGPGFGGRSLCLSRGEVPELPCEISVTVQLDDEAGAAGLVFGSDGADQHYGFYPSAGQLRLTRFDGPNVFTWNILRQIDTPHYRPAEWNRLKVRIEPEKILCFVNGELVTSIDEAAVRKGQAGLAKFRDTRASFKNFEMRRFIAADPTKKPLANDVRAEIEKALDQRGGEEGNIPEVLLPKAPAARDTLLGMAREWDQKAAQARKFARELNQKSIERRMVRAFEPEESRIDLFAAAFLIAQIEAPDLDPEACEEEITNMVRDIRARPASNDRERVDQLRKYLFEDNAFHGSRSDYYNPANSFMNRVLEDREGIPITLSVLFLHLGEKLGIEKLEGMPFPGHFMVRFSEAGKEPFYIDVYDGGKIYAKSELYDFISKHSEVPLLDEHFKPATKKEIISRMLKNLVGFGLQEAPDRTMPYLDLLLALSPEDAFERWRRARLRLQAGSRTLAREDLKWLLEKQPPGFDLERIQELYRDLQ